MKFSHACHYQKSLADWPPPLCGRRSLASSGAAAEATAAADRPNILFLFADDMRPDATASLGSFYIKTPNLDRLASQGVVFRRAHIMGGLQGAICVPSRAMMLSGRSLFQVDEQLRDVPTWPMQLRSVGYETHATGKWHNGAAAAAASFPTARSIFSGRDGSESVRGTDCRFSDMTVNRARNGSRSGIRARCSPMRRSGFWKRASAVRSPWALYVAFTAPHDPRDAPEAFRALYEPERRAAAARITCQSIRLTTAR